MVSRLEVVPNIISPMEEAQGTAESAWPGEAAYASDPEKCSMALAHQPAASTGPLAMTAPNLEAWDT